METMVAVAIVGTIGVGFIYGLFNVSTSTYMYEKRTTAASLAQSQIEYIKSTEYRPDGSYDIIVEPPPGYIVSTETTTIGTGKQEVTIEVCHKDNVVFRMTTLKVDW